MKKLFSKKNLLLLLTTGISLLAVFVATIATAAWFQLDAKPLQSSMVTGSSDITIQSVKGHKISQNLKSNGQVDYTSNTVTTMTAQTGAVDNNQNLDKDEKDVYFDVPTDGIGYYLVKPYEGSYKYHNTYSNVGDANENEVPTGTTNATKFVEYDSGNASLAYISTVDLLTTEPFRIRKYTFEDNKTVNKQVVIGNSGVTVTGASAATVSNGDITVGQNGRYKVWLDYSSNKVGLEYLGTISKAHNTGATRQYGSVTLYFYDKGKGYQNSDSLNFYAYFWKSSNTGTNYFKQMTHHLWASDQDGGSNYWKVTMTDITKTYDRVIFYSGTGTNWAGKYKQTDDLTIPSGIGGDNIFYPTSSGSSGGSWGSYNAVDDEVTIKVGSESAQTMTWSSGDNAFKYTIPSCADNASLTFTVNSSTATVSSNGDGSGWNLNNTTNGSQVTRGGSNITVFLHSDLTVWVSTVYYVYNSTTTTYYQASYVDSSDTTNFKETYNSSTNPNPVRQFKASVTGSAGDTVAFYANSTLKTSNVSLESTSSPAYSNINSSKKLVAAMSGDSVFLKFPMNSSGEVTSWTTATVWADGNKTYDLSINGGSTYPYTMSYCASDGRNGTYNGWYWYHNVSVTAGNTVAIRLNGAALAGVAYYSTDSTNNINSSLKFKASGTVDIFIHTGTKKIYATPIYTITQTRSASAIATLVASYVSGTTFRTAATFDVEDDDVFSVKMNGSAYAVTYNTGSGNNINSSLMVLADADDVFAELNTSGNTLWVDGYHKPNYYVSKDGGTNWVAMTKVVSGDDDYDAGSDPQYKASNLSVSANDVLTFKRNANRAVTATAEAGERNNVTTVSSNVTVRFGGSINVYLKTASYPSTCSVWATGYQMRTYFYNGDQSVSAGTTFYLSCSNDGTTWSLIGAMTADPSDSRLFSADVPVGSYSKMAFHQGNNYSVSSYKTSAIDISISNHENKYCRIDSSSSPFSVKWYDNPPQTGSNKYYLYDKNSTVLGGSPRAYAWHNASENTTTHTYMQYGGSRFPGITMTQIIDGSMWMVEISSNYDRLLFAKADGSRQSIDINVTGHSNAGGVWIITSTLSDSKYTGSFGSNKITSLGTANIKVNNSTVTTMDIGDITKDDGTKGSNYFVYEHGVRAKHGDTLKIDVTSVVGSHDNLSVKVYDGKTYIDTKPHYLNVNTSTGTITVNFGTHTDAYGRFNFYLTTDGLLSIVMVPDLGNGFYIMGYSGDTDGFINARKMNSGSSYEAVYAGFKATKNDQLFVRSYVNSVDTLYETIIIDSSASGKVTDMTGGVMKINETGYYTIEVSNGVVTISKFSFDTFFKVNPLNIRDIANQTAIKNQKTSLVLEVEFKTTNNSFPMAVSLDVTNDIYTYVGVNFYCSKVQQTPYTYMRDNYYTLYNPSSSYSVSNAYSAFRTDIGNGETVYYAYILIDYKYSADLKNMPVDLTGSLSFNIRTAQ